VLKAQMKLHGIWIAAALCVAALLAVASPGLPAEAADGVNVRPIQDFLDQQVLLAPGFGSGVDWISEDKDGNFEYYARLDFTGVINKIQLDGAGLGSLGTTFTGQVTEKVQSDGRTLVHVRLRGKNVFCLVGELGAGNPFAPANRRWGQPAGLVPSQFTIDDLDTVDVQFDVKYLTSDAPGSDLPQIRQLLFFPTEDQEVLQTLIVASGKGRLRAGFGVPDGTPGQLTMTMRGIWNAAFDPAETDYKHDAWPVGRLDLRPVGN